jgi:hypothetical protein
LALHTDIPSRSEIERLLATRGPACASVYLPTSPLKQDIQADQTEFKNLAREAIAQLEAAGADRRSVSEVRELLDDVLEDDDFWAEQANSLALFASPDSARAFRLPNRLTSHVEVADRAPVRRIQGSEGQKVRLRQFARKVDRALRGVLAGLELPLILAATEPMESIYRSVSTYPHLVEPAIGGSPESATEEELAVAARAVLDEVYATELSAIRDRFELRFEQDRASTDVAAVARAATQGAVDTVLVDIDEKVPGRLDEDTGAVELAGDDAASYGVIDEIARRVLLSGGRVLAVRGAEVPGGGPVAAIFRYPLSAVPAPGGLRTDR